MNMLSSLKAMLFSSALPGTAAVAETGQETADFAAMLSGSIAGAATNDVASPPTLPPVEAAATLPDFRTDGDQHVDAPGHDHVPAGLAVAVAAGKGTPASLPPGLALGLVKHDTALPPAPEGEAEPEGEGAIATLPSPEMPDEAIETKATAKVHPTPHKQEIAPEAPFIPVQAEIDVEVAVEAESEGDADSQDRTNVAVSLADMPDAAPLLTPAIPVAPTPVAIEIRRGEADKPPVASQGIAPAPAAVGAERGEADKPLAAAQETAPAVQPVIARMPTPAASTEEGAPRIAPISTPVEQPRTESPSVTAKPDQPSADSPAIPAQIQQSAAPALNGKPVKAEAISLLQLVRDQVSARQSGLSVRVGAQVSAAASAKDEPAPVKADTPPSLSVTAQPLDAAPVTSSAASSPIATLPPASSAPAVDLSASLGAQMVDMGVSGQWIDGLARDIAGLSANGAQGRFQIDTHHLGAVQVDIRQGSEGSAVSLTVASEAAEAALRQDSDRLKLDAGLAAVRISDVRVERAAPVAEAHRADMGNQSSSQQQQPQQHGSQTASAWQQSNQNMGQPQGQQGRWQGRENNAFGPKGSADPAVLNHADAQPRAQDAVRARYA
ncbi:flagellar hook-length control protein FliK [Sphingobium sp. EP60837]|uniref:flagellar hook-length control protein FliK n=1 Tax=Sphingobium sp. EP60837 TaxID=1855519 RepID=UPI0007DE023A|nr:flagellar hook-length control protein FliK [Sphingobium sp. EP60837]ANI78420.1 hypothetical protein EP837_02012 [Sphingobium sp. EP60837]